MSDKAADSDGSSMRNESTESAENYSASQDDQPGRTPSGGKTVLRRLLLGGLIAAPIAVGGLWVAVHSIPWMGPLVANTLRATIGKENVTRLEDFVYGVEDEVNQVLKSGDKPKSYWEVPPTAASAAASAMGGAGSETDDEPQKPALPTFHPDDPGPVHEEWSAEGDGQWVPMVDDRRPEQEPRLYKTLLHPDKSRSWAELFVVAIDLRRVAVMPVMGYQEPRSEKKEAEGYERPSKIPKRHYDALLAAFNGGFMAEHGHYGVYFDGITFLDPKDDACTLAHYRDGSFRIASWSELKDERGAMRWYRQAPNCMYEQGTMHPNLKVHRAKKWGATLDGNTVIRRSAVGLSRDRQILYVGISNHTTAKVMALGMHHAGCWNVAQMDVNWSYPKFVTYEEHEDGLLHPVALADGFEFSDDLYLRERSMRDFFYLARLEEVEAELESKDERLFSTPTEATQELPSEPAVETPLEERKEP